jgi:acetyl-CoA acetyltransferase
VAADVPAGRLVIAPGSIAIVGAAETERLGVLPDISSFGLHTNASLRALADAGLRVSDIDGIATARPFPYEVAHYLGITPRWLENTFVGGCSFMLFVRHAAAALTAGYCDAVLISHGESGRSQVGEPPLPIAMGAPWQQYEIPYGAGMGPFNFTTPVMRFLQERGMERRHLAEVVVAQRQWAKDVTRALRREQMTVDEVLDDRMVAYPFTRSMCCPVTDGGGALVLVRADRVDELDLQSPPVYLLGAGESSGSPIVSQMDDLASFEPFHAAGGEAFRTGQVSHDDIDHLMIYDAFAHLPLYGLEELGFVGRGESGDFIAEGNTRPGGRLPLNTNGGGLSYTHTGMYGMFAIQEAVRQLRGQAEAQAPGVETSFVLGVGMFFAAAGALILSNRRP